MNIGQPLPQSPRSAGHAKGASHETREASRRTRRTTDENTKRVLRLLAEAIHRHVNTNDPIMEQLRQCQEAFKVGEIIGKAFDSLKYVHDGDEIRDRYLPPAGVVIPPLV